jgi:hypothetical protein
MSLPCGAQGIHSAQRHKAKSSRIRTTKPSAAARPHVQIPTEAVGLSQSSNAVAMPERAASEPAPTASNCQSRSAQGIEYPQTHSHSLARFRSAFCKSRVARLKNSETEPRNASAAHQKSLPACSMPSREHTRLRHAAGPLRTKTLPPPPTPSGAARPLERVISPRCPRAGRRAAARRRGRFREPEKRPRTLPETSRPAVFTRGPLAACATVPRRSGWLWVPATRASLVGRGAVRGCCGGRHTCCHRQHAYKGSPGNGKTVKAGGEEGVRACVRCEEEAAAGEERGEGIVG